MFANYCCREKAIIINYWSACAHVGTGRVGVSMLLRACNRAYPACNAYAPYCDVICGPSVSTIFFDIISWTGRFSEKKLLNMKCVFLFSLQLCLKRFLFCEKFSEYRQKCRNVSCKVPVIVVRFQSNLDLFNRFSKISNIKIHQKPSRGNRVISFGQTDITKLIVAFHNFANAPKTKYTCTYLIISHCSFGMTMTKTQ